MPGGPTSTAVIPSFGGHIARDIWEGNERYPEVIECITRKTALRHLQELMDTMSEDVVGDVRGSPLFGLLDLMYEHVDPVLISAFIERWQPDTNSFHLPFGEMTIMLHDVHYILGLPADGVLPPCPSKNEVEAAVTSLFPQEMNMLRASGTYSKGGILDSRLREICTDRRSRSVRARAWYLSLLGSTLLVDKSRDRVRPHAYYSTEDAGSVAWGAVALAYLYRQLGAASRSGTGKFGGCLTLLQAWIYEYFIPFRPHPPRHGEFEGQPRAATWFPRVEQRSTDRLVSIRRLIDGMSEQQVIWCPYSSSPASQCPRTLYLGCIRAYDVVEPYMPDRTVRQLGYAQCIPGPIERPGRASRPATGSYGVTFPSTAVDDSWYKFPRGARLGLDVYRRCISPWDTDADYYDWFCNASHPLLVNEDVPMASAMDDPTASEYWMYEWPRRVMPVLTVPIGQPLPDDMHASLNDLVRSWCQTMHIAPPSASQQQPPQ